MLTVGIDVLVLGCTHFPAMRETFVRVVGPGVAVIDSGAAIARQTRRVLAEREWLGGEGNVASDSRALTAADSLWCSGDIDQFARVAEAILGMPVGVRGAPEMVSPSSRAS
jgi:glutamate racemase